MNETTELQVQRANLTDLIQGVAGLTLILADFHKRLQYLEDQGPPAVDYEKLAEEVNLDKLAECIDTSAVEENLQRYVERNIDISVTI